MPTAIEVPRRASAQPSTARKRNESHARAGPGFFGLFLFDFLLLFFLDAI